MSYYPSNPNGQAVMADSSPVVIASDQSPVAVVGPLTDTELRATAVPVSGPLTDVQLRATAVPVSGPLTDVQLRAAAVPVSISASTARIGFTASSGIWYDDSTATLGTTATFTGTSRDVTAVATDTAYNSTSTFAQEIRVASESDQAGTLWIEASRDNSNWRRIKEIGTTAITGGFSAELIHRPSWRYIRVGYTNSVTPQGRFTIGTIMMAA